MKKVLIFCLLLSLAIGMVGCEELPTDETLIARAKELIPKTEAFNDLFYITGIPVDTTAKEENGYIRADATQLNNKGITKIADSLSMMNGVWSEGYIERFQKSSLVSSVVDGSNIAAYVYCYDKYDKSGTFVCVMVSTDGVPIQGGAVEYLYDTLAVESKTGDTATLTITVKVTNQEGSTKKITLDVALVKGKDGVWLLDSNTVVVYPQDSYPLPL